MNQYQGDDSPPPTAHSGDGLWGTVLYDDYTNSGGTSFLKKTVDRDSGFQNDPLDRSIVALFFNNVDNPNVIEKETNLKPITGGNENGENRE